MIIPVYNVRPYLREALDSVINQTYKNLEIIIVDDGSTDGSGMICDEYKEDHRVNVIHQENRGLSSARNTGMVIATGEIMAFLDSDDAFHSEMIQTIVAVMLEYNADVVCCKYMNFWTKGKMKLPEIKDETEVRILDKYSALRALAKGTVDHCTWNKIYRSRIRKQILFPQGRVYEDIDTTYQILSNSDRVCIIENNLIAHRKRKGSITERLMTKDIFDYVKANSNFISFIEINTPHIFSKEDELYAKSSLISVILGFSTRERSKETRMLVVKTARDIDIKKCGMRIMVEYWMFEKCPWLLNIIYPGFRRMRRILTK